MVRLTSVNEGSPIKKLLKSFISDERGLETVEYAIITAVIIVGTIVVLGLIGAWVAGTYTGVNAQLPPIGP